MYLVNVESVEALYMSVMLLISSFEGCVAKFKIINITTF